VINQVIAGKLANCSTQPNQNTETLVTRACHS